VKGLALGLALLATLSARAEIQMAITFDDLPRVGPRTQSETATSIVKRVVDVLAKHEIRGVVAFVNGERINGPDTRAAMQLWIDSGHFFGNHTWSHPDLHKSEVAAYLEEISHNDQTLARLYSAFYRKIFRYPFLHEGEALAKRDAVRAHLVKLSLPIAQVSVDINEYLWNGPYLRCLKAGQKEKLAWLRETLISEATENLRGAEMLSQKLFSRSIKHITLFHPFEFDSLVLDEILTRWEHAGVRFVSLDEAMSDPAYAINPNIIGPSWTFLNQVRRSRGLENPPELQKIYDRSTQLEGELARVCR